ncbi:MAG: cyclic peptide export ABC transporter [Cyclobacteriaceae bacterium]
MQIVRILIKSSFPLFLTGCIASILTGLCSTIVIKTIHQAVQGRDFSEGSFLFQFASSWIAYGGLSIIASYVVSLMTQRIIHELRVKLSNQILSAKFVDVERKQSQLLPILTEDIKTIAYSIDHLPGVTTGLATVIGVLIYMVWYSPILTGSTFLLFLLVFLFTKFTAPFVRKYANGARKYLDQIYLQFEGLVFGIKELTLNQDFKKSYMDDQIIPTSKSQNKFYLKENVILAITNRSSDMILLGGMACLILVISRTDFITLDFFGEYLTLVLFTLAPLATAAGFVSSIKRIEVSLDHIEKAGLSLITTEVENSTIENAAWTKSEPLVKLKAVRHNYYHSEEDESFTMGPINLDILSGELVFLVGGNGSGKTTLAKIILGLYNSQEGQLAYRGVQVSHSNLAYYRSRFSAVFTDSYVFDKLLHIDKRELLNRSNEVISMLELSKKVKIENGSFNTKRLSDGQKKRLSLVISILEDKEIYLFDEWAANQDPHFKEVFYTKILPYLKGLGKTIIVITHDDRYFHLADQLIKLRDGQVSDQI